MRAAAGAFDAAGGLLFRPPAKRAHPAPRNLLIIRLDHLGDVWNITGLPKAVKEHFSGCRVSCLVPGAAIPLLEANPFIDEIIRYNAPWFWKRKNGARASAPRDLARELAGRRFDAVLSIRGDVREHWLAYRAGIPRRIGPDITGGGFLLTDVVPYRAGRHEFERISDAAEPLGLPRKIWPPEIHFAPGEKEKLLAEAQARGLRPEREIIGFQVEAGTTAKTWSLEHRAAFINGFLKKRPDAFVALLGLDGRALAEAVDPRFQERVLDLCGRLSLRELAAAADRFRLVVAPDSGPAHMLAWLGTPTLFLYSGVNTLESWRPLAERATVLRHDVPCSPCGLRVCTVPGHPCMEEIRPERAVEAALERL